MALSLGDRLMLILASLRVRPTVGDPCDKLSYERAYGDVPKLPRGFVGERISHSPEPSAERQRNNV